MSRTTTLEVTKRYLRGSRARGGVALALAVAATCAGRSASATERHFNTTYESGVVAPGKVELEPWTTWRAGRSRFYNRFDQRLEFEVGVVENLQTSLYWNFSASAADEVVDPVTGEIGRVGEFEFEGIASEWKYKLSDPVADAVGFALYLEGALGPVEAAVEPKLILDKRMGDLLFAANAVAEVEWEFADPDATEEEVELALETGLGYFITPAFTAGVELRFVNVLEEGELESSIIGAGPSVSYASEGWWVSASVLPQLVAFEGSSAGSRLNLDSEEYVRTRVIFGLDL